MDTAQSLSSTPETNDFFCNPPENEEAYEFACRLELERNHAIRAIMVFCKEQKCAEKSWKDQPHIKALFDLEIAERIRGDKGGPK